MSEHNPNQLRLIGSLAGYEKGVDVRYVAPSPEEPTPETASRTLAAEAALGALSMLNEADTPGAAMQDPTPGLFEELNNREATIPSNIILGEN